MTPQEAIKFLQETQVGCRFTQDKKLYDVCVLSVEALEKQIPKKPLEENKYYGIGKCPNCGAIFLDKTTKYCGNCGQALDWS